MADSGVLLVVGVGTDTSQLPFLNVVSVVCEQAHLVCYSPEYLAGGSRQAKRAGEKNGA